MKESIQNRDFECDVAFCSLGTVFHACTQEDHEIIFASEEDFQAGMSILAICERLFPQVRILTFQFMNNHIHFVLCGNENDIQAFFEMFRNRLRKHLESVGKFVNLSDLKLKTFPIDTLDYARSAIAYVNRNCFILNENTTPFSYPWGSGSCYFSKAMFNYYSGCRQQMSQKQIRGIIHSKMADTVKPIYMLDGYASPLSFCDVSAGESLFRSERHYFYCMSKNVESYKKIAESIGESIFYTDEDLYQVVCSMARKQYGDVKPSLLEPSAKLEIARELFYSYHSGRKQIARMLKLDPAVLNRFLPTATKP